MALTAHALPEEKAHILGQGFDSHVTKPIQINLLLEQMNLTLSARTVPSTPV